MENYTSYEQLPLTLSVDQLAGVLQIGMNTAYDLIHSGEICTKRINRQIRIPKTALIVYLSA